MNKGITGTWPRLTMFSCKRSSSTSSKFLFIFSAHNLVWDWIDTECFINNGLEKLAEWWKDGYIAAIGPGCTCTHEARFASSVDFPLIDYVSRQRATSIISLCHRLKFCPSLMQCLLDFFKVCFMFMHVYYWCVVMPYWFVKL